ncbi:hypothetical protein ACFFU1_09860 [Algibacter miyuki]|uniref:Outer membrane protein beta-barrel domain-containing protein n=1 Tax=Algibacter miyuki TaxID=1306933 RepID=A0ABV5H164_9FLAO|nr:hypothetical protein [Algibacter miyuki]MDN3667485.1 hypothetical protein [Algibacter miyuki]
MKKLLLLSVCLLAVTLTSNAQDIADHAIGLRLGDSDGLGAEVSYQHALGDNNRIEADLGWRNNSNYDAFKLAGLYQWVWNIEGGFNWYAGVGGGVASYSGKKEYNDNDNFGVFAAGDIGIEYSFDFPLLLSLDFRPEIGNNDFTDNTIFDIALGVRYQF